LQADTIIIPSLINTYRNWDVVDSRGYTCYRKQWLPSWIGNLYRENIETANYINAKTKIYISRALADYRKIENEDEVVNLLQGRGYGVYHLETMTVLEQIKLFSTASIVIGTHGAGFSNIYFCDRGTIIFEFFSEYYQDSSFKVLANVLGLEYHYTIGTTHRTEGIHPQQENIYIDVSKLEIALELVDTMC
jgi:capsular polysaccharide biosynthesis protein